MTIVTVGIDLAKNVFAVHGVDENGKAGRVKPKITRDQLLPLVVQLPPCLIGMEACCRWARSLVERRGTFAQWSPSPRRMRNWPGFLDLG